MEIYITGIKQVIERPKRSEPMKPLNNNEIRILVLQINEDKSIAMMTI